jgi:DNA-binding response OmpR family regulator
MQPSRPGNHKTVLIIEDEPDTAEMLAEMMRLSGYTTLHAYSAQPVLNLLLSQRPDIVLMDVILPDRSGIELLRLIRQDPRLENLPVILISGNCQPADIQNGLLAGASAYLTKPVAFWELKENVDRLIRKNMNSPQ